MSRTADFEWRDEPLGERAGVGAAGLGRHGEFAAEVIDVGGQFHGATMAS